MYEISDPGHIRSNELSEIAWRAFYEFNDLADYIWKSPRFIENETKLERKKLDIYFSKRPDMAELRWKHESKKLTSVFPYLIAVGNLSACISLYENYLLLLHQMMKRYVPIREDLIRGQGASRSTNYFKEAGIAVGSIDLYEQVNAATRIRNCLVHAAGVLSNSREESELRKIQTKRIYLDRHLRRKLLEDKEISIFNTDLGDRLQITNSYSHLACSYVRDFYPNLCKAIDVKYVMIP